MSDRTAAIDQIRWFNRHYVPLMQLLNAKYLDTGYSTMECDVIIELFENDGITATDLVAQLGIDKGYLSRLLTRCEKAGVLVRTSSPHDGRVRLLHLTRAGREFAINLIKRGEQLVDSVFGNADDAQLAEAAACTRRIMQIIENGSASDSAQASSASGGADGAADSSAQSRATRSRKRDEAAS
ncbi:MAG: MarR family winged helix-turn-helix transcriptional regulator [Eggerthellaceae bacterium]|jgi:DNA-binding MarR family transcriptional regulator